MFKRIVSGLMLTLLLISMLTFTLNIQPAKASGTIYIRADGSIDPPTAPILRNGDLYTLTGNITSDTDGIVIERNNMTLEGAGYTLQSGKWVEGIGMYLSDRSNVTIKNIEITYYYCSIYLWESSNCSIVGNNIMNNAFGIVLEENWNNTIVGNAFIGDGLIVGGESFQNKVEDNVVNGEPLVYLENVSDYTVYNAGQVILVNCDNIRVRNLDLSYTTVGIELWGTNNSKIENNNMANNEFGLALRESSDNNIVRNNITNNRYGIQCSSSNNFIYHNNFINNGAQVYLWPIFWMPPNSWDNGYPSGGNYWSDYEERYPNAREIDDSGIWDTSYIIEVNNHDYYPLVNPWSPMLGDVNGDDIIDLLDLVTAADAFGAVPGSWAWNPLADIYPDCCIDIFDLVMIALRFGQHY